MLMPIHMLVLPGSPTTLPAAFHEHAVDMPLGTDAPNESDGLIRALQALPTVPDLLIGGIHTPALLWLRAVERFPSAAHWLCTAATPLTADDDCWIKRGATLSLTGQRKPATASQPSLRPATANPTEPAVAVTADPVPSVTAPARPPVVAMSDAEFLREIFRLSAWGDTPENTHKRQNLELQASQLPHAKVLLPRLHKARRNGIKAHELWLEVEKRLQRDGESAAVTAWLDGELANCHHNIQHHIGLQLDKWRKWRKGKQANAHQPNRPGTKLPAVAWKERGQHPNSLQSLAPCAQWDILIDETGSSFDLQAHTLPANDTKVGRVVALAVPQTCQLPALAGFHATDASDETIHQALATLLTRPVGLFGFSVKDSASIGIHWLSHIRQLIRWTLLQLPHTSGTPLHVTCLIEQRGPWHSASDLGALEELLTSELIALDAERYQDLVLQLRLIKKQDDPRIGYADAVAWCWGSPSRSAKEMLKQTRWERHCLLHPDQAAMERIYLALNRQAKLSAADWYTLCSAVDQEQGNGVLHHYLQQLGATCQQDPTRWLHYLDEIKLRMAHKQYRTTELCAALGWLDHYRPEAARFPLTVELQLALEQLALANHRGVIDLPRFQRVIQLVDALFEEDAPTACHAVLRLATMGTNYFDFQTIQPELNLWLAEPVAVVGLLNHAKLHSTQGQLHAFRGEHHQAQQSFDLAIQAFDRLSDQSQAQRERQQTRCYALINQMDHQLPPAWLPALHHYLQASLGKETWVEIARSLAHAGHGRRFEHHLFLRACIQAPAGMMEAWQAYLALKPQWQQEADHPWPLINTYRAWLLQSAGEQPDALSTMQAALAACSHPANGATLHWMACVLEQLALALGIPVTAPGVDLATLRQHLPQAPHDLLAACDTRALRQPPDHNALLAWLQQCLPFNFH